MVGAFSNAITSKHLQLFSKCKRGDKIILFFLYVETTDMVENGEFTFIYTGTSKVDTVLMRSKVTEQPSVSTRYSYFIC